MLSFIFQPKNFIKFANFTLKILYILVPILLAISLYYALYSSPPDYQQHEMVRAMYVHVPAAWLSLAIYSTIAICSFIFLIWKTPMMYIISISLSPIGATFNLITLISGAIWGKPIWGVWWVWDARLTSMLILFFLYISHIIIYNMGCDIWRASKPASILSIIGFINIPIIKFSVNIWYSLHQGSTITGFSTKAIHNDMLIPLMLSCAFFITYSAMTLLLRVKYILTLVNSQKNS